MRRQVWKSLAPSILIRLSSFLVQKWGNLWLLKVVVRVLCFNSDESCYSCVCIVREHFLHFLFWTTLSTWVFVLFRSKLAIIVGNLRFFWTKCGTKVLLFNLFHKFTEHQSYSTLNISLSHFVLLCNLFGMHIFVFESAAIFSLFLFSHRWWIHSKQICLRCCFSCFPPLSHET